ncbi:MAG TPA: sterol desaturase family protein [Candidatus Dormibacteraeota bacterium]|nr:sterol desaturase family protein [Candidatus Dormibacteraeota bacterium]
MTTTTPLAAAEPVPALSLAATDSPRSIAEALPVFLSHGSPRVAVAALVIAVAARLAVGEWSAWDLLPVAAIVAYWPIQEWLIHVYILHYRPLTVFGRQLDFRVPRKHREHHRAPWEIDVLFIPMHSFLYTLPLLVLLWFVVTPSTPLALTGIVAHLALTLHYEWVHYLVHTRYQPTSSHYQRLWRNHRLHHFKNEHYWMGVTMTSGDRLFGTEPAVKDVETSPTCRTLAAG